MPDRQVIIIVVADGYNSFLSVPVSIPLPHPFVVHSVTEDRGIWNSFTTVPYLTNLIVRTDGHLLAVIVGRPPVCMK
jgi:hypothetical protein